MRLPFALIACAAVRVTSAATVVLAGGCFWCMEQAFEKVPGVSSAVSGYSGGTMLNPTYRNHGQHVEVIEVTYDEEVVSFAQLTAIFWYNVDPLNGNGQFCDNGHSYLSVLFYYTTEEQVIALGTKRALEADKGWAIKTSVAPRKQFWKAEEYHQDYYKKNPDRYNYYKTRCGRVSTLKARWTTAGYDKYHPYPSFTEAIIPLRQVAVNITVGNTTIFGTTDGQRVGNGAMTSPGMWGLLACAALSLFHAFRPDRTLQ